MTEIVKIRYYTDNKFKQRLFIVVIMEENHMLYEYLEANYRPNGPIFVSDVDLPVTDVNLRRMFKALCDSGKIKRFDKGVYYIPKQSRLKGGVPLGADAVARAKYVSRNGKIAGYYSGYTFANQLGITTQVPYVIEIVSNNASSRFREIDLNGRKIVLRKPKTVITDQNYRILQLLDLLSNITQYADQDMIEAASRVKEYIQKEKIKREEVDQYIGEYPERIYKNMYEMRFFDVFT